MFYFLIAYGAIALFAGIWAVKRQKEEVGEYTGFEHYLFVFTFNSLLWPVGLVIGLYKGTLTKSMLRNKN